MANQLMIVFITTLVIQTLCAVPVTYIKGDKSPRKTLTQNLHSKLTKLRQLLKDLDEEEQLLNVGDIFKDKPNQPAEVTSGETSSEKERNLPEVTSEEAPLEKSVADNDLAELDEVLNAAKVIAVENDEEHSTADDIVDYKEEDDGINNTDEEPPKENVQSGTDYQHLKDVAMKRFLDSLSDESLKDLEIIRTLTKDDDTRDKKADSVVEGKENSTYFEHALTDSELNEANWRNLVKQLENQRDQLVVQKQIKTTDKQGKKIEPYANNGVFGKFTEEVKESVEKNLLSDVALAIHSGISIDDLIEDILGKEKASIM